MKIKKDVEELKNTFEKFLNGAMFSFDGRRAFVVTAEYDKEHDRIRCDMHIHADSGSELPKIEEIKTATDKYNDQN